MRRRLRPVAGVAIEIIEEPSGIGDVAVRLEGVVECGEGVGMGQQIDLHAADVDIAHAARLQTANFGNRCLLARQKAALALGIDGPGPGKICPLFGIPMAGFDQGQGFQQMCRDMLQLFLQRRLLAAHQGIGLGQAHSLSQFPCQRHRYLTMQLGPVAGSCYAHA